MTTNPTHISAPPGELFWRYSMPAERSAKMLLLTVGKVAEVGNWIGGYGDLYIAWCPLPQRDKALEGELQVA
jgi:hypothetical protein